MSIIKNFNFKYNILTNSAILYVLANLLMSYVSFKHFETYTLTGNIVVSALIIISSLFIFIRNRVNRIYTSNFLLGDVFITNVFFIFLIFLGFCFINFLLIRYCSMADQLISAMDIMNSTPKVIIVSKMFFLSIIMSAVLLFQFSVYQKSFKCKKVADVVNAAITKYHLDKKSTTFFVDDDSIEAFKSGNYLFLVNHGLLVDNRYYSPSSVYEYLNISNIRFHELNVGHIKNIEMYNI